MNQPPLQSPSRVDPRKQALLESRLAGNSPAGKGKVCIYCLHLLKKFCQNAIYTETFRFSSLKLSIDGKVVFTEYCEIFDLIFGIKEDDFFPNFFF